MTGSLKMRAVSFAAAAGLAAGLFLAVPAGAETSTPETAASDQWENSYRYEDGVEIEDPDAPVVDWEDVLSGNVGDVGLYDEDGNVIVEAEQYNGVTYKGIDVSYHQGYIDWEAVKEAGVQFAILRCGIGSEYDGEGENRQDDEYWYYNVSECERLGIPYGVYLFSYAENTTMAASEARHTISLLSGHTPDLPVYLDIEANCHQSLSPSLLGDIAETWCDMVSAAGYRVGIYSYTNFWNNKLTDSRFNNSSWYHWVAETNSTCAYQGRYEMWQFSHKGSVPGIDTDVDLNYWYGEFPGKSDSNDSSGNTGYTGWKTENGREYWYEDGVKQGTTGRGKEVYDPNTGAWYWLDAVQGGAKAVDKDVYQESNGGKWVHYDSNGQMVKGEQCINGSWYYFEPVTGAMIHGPWTLPDGRKVLYDLTTGVMQYGTVTLNGRTYTFDSLDGDMTSGTVTDFWLTVPTPDGTVSYWYEGWVRQGWNPASNTFRGKEIYDPASDAWYWLDNVQQGAKAVSKEVYQDSNGGKWVRYDAVGAMIKGWYSEGSSTWYYDLITGAMYKGWYTIDGYSFHFDETTGLLM